MGLYLYVTNVQTFQTIILDLKFQTDFRRMRKEERNILTLANHGGAADSFTEIFPSHDNRPVRLRLEFIVAIICHAKHINSRDEIVLESKISPLWCFKILSDSSYLKE